MKIKQRKPDVINPPANDEGISMTHQITGEPKTECINLRDHFGRRFRISCEESCGRAHHNSQCDSWYAIILCRYGHIGVQGGDRLLACTNRRGRIAAKLAALPCVQVLQDGADGINAAFHVSDFAMVAKVMKPRSRPRLTTEQRERLAERARANFGLSHSSSTDRGFQDDPTHADASP